MVVSPELFAPTFHSSHVDLTNWSRCDLALGNRAALGLVARVSVASGIMDGGHCPVLLELRDRSWTLPWRCPRPRVPQWLQVPSRELRSRKKWKDLSGAWQGPSAMQQLGSVAPDASPDTHSLLLEAALQALVDGAGGWETQATCRRPAYESNSVRKARRTIDLFGHCLAQLNREHGDGSYTLTDTAGAVDRAPPARLPPSHVLTRHNYPMGCSRTGRRTSRPPRRPAVDAL